MTGEAAAAFEKWVKAGGVRGFGSDAFLAGWEARGRVDLALLGRIPETEPERYEGDNHGDTETSAADRSTFFLARAIRSLDVAHAAEGKEGGDGR